MKERTIFRKPVNEEFESDLNSFSFRVLQFVLAALLICFVISFVSPVSAQTRQGRVVSANDYPGAELGAKINAADKALGAAAGEIVVKGGGTISTQVILSSDHVLHFLPGRYV